MLRSMTRVGHDRLIAKQKRLSLELDAVIGRNKEASRIGTGDFNAPTSSDGCDHDEHSLRARIDEIDRLFVETTINIVPTAKQTSTVQIGQIVTISMSDGEQSKIRTFWIDGFAETEPDFQPQVVGYYVPMIQPLIGLRLGDVTDVELRDDRTGKKTVYEVKILKIELPTEAQETQHLKKKAA